MGRLVIASQLNETFNATLAEHVAARRHPAGADRRARGPAEGSRDPDRRAVPQGRRRAVRQNRRRGWPFDLRWVQLVSVGIDFYPDMAVRRPGRHLRPGDPRTVALAEFALAAIFAAAKRLPEIWIDRAERWSPTPLAIVEGQTLGIVGFGSIGEALAPKARALGLDVLAVRRTNRPISIPGVERVADIETLFERSDHVVLAAPATIETNGLVNRALLAHAKPGLHLINIARGALIDDDALLEALDDGRRVPGQPGRHPPRAAARRAPILQPPAHSPLAPHLGAHAPDTHQPRRQVRRQPEPLPPGRAFGRRRRSGPRLLTGDRHDRRPFPAPSSPSPANSRTLTRSTRCCLPSASGVIPVQPTVELERLYRKQRLAAGYRLFGRNGFDMGGAGHITARDPEHSPTISGSTRSASTSAASRSPT
jgi:phosphoglycerate dehydrogenase-like enzyme